MAERPYETRTVTASIELRDDGDGADAPVLTGYASTFNAPYTVGYFREQIHPDAFKRTLAGSPDVRLLVDHEGQPLARTKSGTLQLSSDGVGLQVRATLDTSDPDVQRLLPKMRRGDLDQMSFAFRVPVDGDAWDYSGDMPSRTIREANLSGGDVSVVTYPANEGTTAAVRRRDETEAAYTLAYSMLAEARSGRKFDEANTARLHSAVTMLGFEANGAAPAEVRSRRLTLTTEDLRALADLSYTDRQSALSDALLAMFAPSDDDDDAENDMWVVDASDEWVVWRQWGDCDPGIGLWRMTYTADENDQIAFTSDPEKVVTQTSYMPVPAQQNSATTTTLDLARRQAELLTLHRR